MKRLLLLTIFILCSSFVLTDNIYQYDYLDLQLKIDGKFDLIPESSSAKISNVKVNLLLYPENDHRQQLKEIVTFGEVENGKLVFEWDDKQIEEKQYGYTALVNTINSRNKVKNRVQFPLSKIDVDHDYLLPTLKINSDNPDIIAKATEIAEGEDDLFKVTFKLASWIDENIDYDLNELTTNKAQKASWVLEHRQGVCDEMASLFVAMCRSLGIPAKFVSGISYTSNQEVVNTVGSNWAGHGWAEVYFPNIGWVSFDLTFTEYGYIDVTHIKLTEGLDTDDASTETKFEWLANDVNLQSFPPETTVEIVNRGIIQKEEIVLEQEILDNNIEPGSYNLIKGILKNTADYYVATTLKLALPEEVEIIGRDKRQILLSPKEVRETYWIVKVSDDLNKGYSYTFPVLIYSEKNTTVKDTFSASSGENLYSLSDIEELTISDEEKVYSRRIFFSCDYQREVKLMIKLELNVVLKIVVILT
jgi:transglutaminase-like putative cysteine protease